MTHRFLTSWEITEIAAERQFIEADELRTAADKPDQFGNYPVDPAENTPAWDEDH